MGRRAQATTSVASFDGSSFTRTSHIVAPWTYRSATTNASPSSPPIGTSQHTTLFCCTPTTSRPSLPGTNRTWLTASGAPVSTLILPAANSRVRFGEGWEEVQLRWNDVAWRVRFSSSFDERDLRSGTGAGTGRPRARTCDVSASAHTHRRRVTGPKRFEDC